MGLGKQDNHYAGFHRRPGWSHPELVIRLHHDLTTKLDIEAAIPLNRARLLAAAAASPDSQFDELFQQALHDRPDFLQALWESPGSVFVFRQLLLDLATF